MDRKLMKAKELAAYIGTTVGGVYQLVSRRQIPFVKIGRSTRFDVHAIDKFIERQSVKPLSVDDLIGGERGYR